MEARAILSMAMRAGGLVLLLAAGCSTGGPDVVGYRYFEPADRSDPVYAQIIRWQANERAAADFAAPPSPLPPPPIVDSEAQQNRSPSPELTAEYSTFVSSLRRRLAEQVREWVQSEARRRYRADEYGDEWPTFDELLRRGEDDCDGLELLSLHALRALGFQEVYRAAIEQRSDGSQHMVTLWFEDPQDPWVIDPTGFATTRVIRMSELPAWEPRAVFTEDRIFGVRRSASR